jgi:hypothetical protein
VITLAKAEKLLETYSLEEIIEINERTGAEVLEFLVNETFLNLPDPEPVDLDDDL